MKPFAEQLMALLGIEKFADQPVRTYSGGNRRKLSLGLAFIGDPKVVFLGMNFLIFLNSFCEHYSMRPRVGAMFWIS